jgi:hypothetical protein
MLKSGAGHQSAKKTIQFIGSTYHVTANKDGEWEVMLSNLKAVEVY